MEVHWDSISTVRRLEECLWFSYEEVLYNILIELRVPMKLVTLTEMCLNETYNKVHVSVGKHLCDTFHIQSGLKHGNVLTSQLFNIIL
jgi:hypothetical protein